MEVRRWGPFLSSYHVSSGDLTRVMRPGSKDFIYRAISPAPTDILSHRSGSRESEIIVET